MLTLNFSIRRSGANVCCPAHPDAVLVEDAHAGDLICPMCGLVVGDRYAQFYLENMLYPNDMQ